MFGIGLYPKYNNTKPGSCSHGHKSVLLEEGMKYYTEGKITISRVQSNVEDDYISVEIKYSGKYLRGRMQLKEYANCISGLARQQILIEIK